MYLTRPFAAFLPMPASTVDVNADDGRLKRATTVCKWLHYRTNVRYAGSSADDCTVIEMCIAAEPAAR
jgi:hypothetical protein